MNENQVKGESKVIAGKIQEQFGDLTNSHKQQVKGATKQVEGQIQKGAGDVEQALDDANEDE